MADEIIFGKHPTPSSLGAEAAVMSEEDEVGALAITPLEHLELSLVRRRGGVVSVEAQLHGHAACLGQVRVNGEEGEASSHSLCRSMCAGGH
jgi:hypothetical protein